MNNSSNKDQHYALDSSGNIRHIKDANPSNDEFFCLFCHRQMIAKQGKYGNGTLRTRLFLLTAAMKVTYIHWQNF